MLINITCLMDFCVCSPLSSCSILGFLLEIDMFYDDFSGHPKRLCPQSTGWSPLSRVDCLSTIYLSGTWGPESGKNLYHVTHPMYGKAQTGSQVSIHVSSLKSQ